MKCPHCGTELERENTCSNCGTQTKDSDKEIEVEYKEFSLSEFLEIRHKQHTAQEDGSKISSMKNGEVLPKAKKGRRVSQKPHKKLLNVSIVLLIVIVVISILFLLKFVFEK